MDKKNYYGNMILFLTALIWGSAFVAQKGGMDHVGPFTFSAARCTLSSLFLFIFIILKDKFFKNEKNNLKEYAWSNKFLIVGGVFCGILLFTASSLQQVGIVYTTVGKAAFITTLYILITPIFALFIGHRVNFMTWLSVILGIVGLYLLAVVETGIKNINFGDLIEFIGAFFWATHILVIDKYSKNVDTIKLSFIQFLITTILAWTVAFIFEDVNLEGLKLSFYMIAYAGIFSGGIAYTLQMVGQKYSSNPTLSSLILSFEAVFGAITGYIFFNEILSTKELLGCIIMFVAVIIAQLPSKNKA